MANKLLFIHHSTGGNLIHQGDLRKILYAQTKDIEFWDHGYNLYPNLPAFLLRLVANKLTFHTGLSDPHGQILGKDFNIVLGNDNPGDYEKIFCSDSTTSNTLKQILDFDIIAFKHCFPTTKIESDSKLERYKRHYKNMANCFAKYQDKIFIPFTPPPLRKESTKPEYAQRAKSFATWMTKEWERSKNVKVFDFFSLLADSNGYLKKEYCPLLKIDSHPNKCANKKIVPVLIDFISNLD